jgi:hypothetical protein
MIFQVTFYMRIIHECTLIHKSIRDSWIAKATCSFYPTVTNGAPLNRLSFEMEPCGLVLIRKRILFGRTQQPHPEHVCISCCKEVSGCVILPRGRRYHLYLFHIPKKEKMSYQHVSGNV